MLRMRALLEQVLGDESVHRDYRDRYRAMATSPAFEGHMKWPKRCHDDGHSATSMDSFLGYVFAGAIAA